MDTSVNAANLVVSVGADLAFDADPTLFSCLVRFESSSVPTTLPTAYDVYPLDGRRDGGYYAVFFFLAEDGIRDYKVTGVQTCALPISALERQHGSRHGLLRRHHACRACVRGGTPYACSGQAVNSSANDPHGRADARYDVISRIALRSEERRVGKEGRSRWSPYH